MSETYSQCPKCGHKPPQPLPDSDPCPACGIYIFKWKGAQEASRSTQVDVEDEDFSVDEPGFIGSLILPLEEADAISLIGRCALLLLLAFWGWNLFGFDYRTGEVAGSFMHSILLPIHEAGHVLFRPLGEFMMILGGSFFQLALPFGIGVAFIVKNRDNFGAAVGLWWGGSSLVDLSPYIYDALHPQLTLLGGSTGEDGPHDWIYLLSVLGQLRNAQFWGGFAHWCGGLLILIALVWGAIVLWRSLEALDEHTKWTS